LVYSIKRAQGREIPDQILWVGATADLPAQYAGIPMQDLKGERALIPGLVDCHTHLIFAGDRSDEFASRCGGATYEEIAAKGGGIVSTVAATRRATHEELEVLAVERLKQAYAFGVRTLEVKSGYGLSYESELKILEVIPKLQERFPEMTLTATFLGAHAFPKDQTREAYIDELLHKMIPDVASKKLADTCDVFIDQGYYTLDEGRTILEAAQKAGLKIKVHADELANTESASLACSMGALSADHLLCVSEKGLQDLARSETVAVLLPSTAFYLKASHAPARKLLDAGARVAISTDFNPGTSMTLSLPTTMTIAALYLGMTRAELFAAVTYNAARALDLHSKKGTLEPGFDAQFAILPFQRFEEIYYRFAWAPI
jgi:imidazolonepropionase